MPSAVREGDSIAGRTTGEHHGHLLPHLPSDLGGSVYVPPKTRSVFINGKQAAVKGDQTNEWDNCGSGKGSIAVGSSNVFVNGKPFARKGDKVNPHNGNATISGGSPNVKVN
jgi:ribosome-associated protein YbcJ (S4-like RNA binding protein)